MKVSRTDLIRALEIALGPAELEHERSPDVGFFSHAEGMSLRGQTGEAAGWDVVSADRPIDQPFFVPGRPLLQALKEIRDEHVEVSRVAQEIQLTAGGYRAVFWCRPALSPPLASPESQAFHLDRNVVGELGALVAYARPKGRNRSVFPGIHLRLGPSGLCIVATDGRRLAQASATEPASTQEASAIVPGRFLILASRHLELDQPTSLLVGEASVALCQGERGVSGSVLAGPMPSYKALLPGETQHRGRLRRPRAIEAIRQARLFSGRVLLQLDEDKLYLSTPESPDGLAEILVGVEWAGPPYRAQLNSEEFLEALENLPGDETGLEVQGERAPVVLRGAGSTFATLMPLLW
jgi:DNA polymerase III sliding clamp (beta) subunit (PCNA family)